MVGNYDRTNSSDPEDLGFQNQEIGKETGDFVIQGNAKALTNIKGPCRTNSSDPEELGFQKQEIGEETGDFATGQKKITSTNLIGRL